jgi:hypothetical protein
VAGRIININGEALQVFEYATPSAADADARRVSADGTTIGTSKPTWMATPHFFKSGKLIVLYIGRNKTIVDLLRTALVSPASSCVLGSFLRESEPPRFLRSQKSHKQMLLSSAHLDG